MQNLAKVLKDEIRRLARQEAKTSMSTLRAENSSLRRALVEQQRRLTSLERAVKKTALVTRNAVAVVDDDVDGIRFTPKMVLSLRTDFGMSQTDFGFLVGVTRLTVSQWERKKGYLVLRNATRASLGEIFKLSPEKAKRKLARIKK